MQIQAADLDSGVNSRISYQLGTGDRMKHFKIDAHNGIVSVASALDREMVRNSKSHKKFIFLIIIENWVIVEFLN